MPHCARGGCRRTVDRKEGRCLGVDLPAIEQELRRISAPVPENSPASSVRGRSSRVACKLFEQHFDAAKALQLCVVSEFRYAKKIRLHPPGGRGFMSPTKTCNRQSLCAGHSAIEEARWRVSASADCRDRERSGNELLRRLFADSAPPSRKSNRRGDPLAPRRAVDAEGNSAGLAFSFQQVRVALVGYPSRVAPDRADRPCRHPAPTPDVDQRLS